MGKLLVFSCYNRVGIIGVDNINELMNPTNLYLLPWSTTISVSK